VPFEELPRRFQPRVTLFVALLITAPKMNDIRAAKYGRRQGGRLPSREPCTPRASAGLVCRLAIMAFIMEHNVCNTLFSIGRIPSWGGNHIGHTRHRRSCFLASHMVGSGAVHWTITVYRSECNAARRHQRRAALLDRCGA